MYSPLLSTIVQTDRQSEHLNIFLPFLRPAVGLSASCEATLLM